MGNNLPKVLLVDDRRENIIALQHVLKNEIDADFVSAESGNEALAMTLTNDFALALIDVQMPEMDGFEMVSILRDQQKTKYLPVIFVSAIYRDEIHQIKGIEAGAVDFIPKPINPQMLIGKVRIFLDLYQQRKISEEQTIALINAKTEWEETFDAIPDIVSIQDRDMRIIRINQVASKLFGCDKKDLEGKFCYKIFRGTQTPCDNCPEIDTFSDAKPHSKEITHESLGKTFLVSSAPIHNDKDEFQKVVHIAKDITEEKKVQAMLQQAQKMESIGTLAGGVAHDFNNILSAIIGYTELMQMDLNEDERNRFQANLEQVLQASYRAKDLVQQILSFSHQTDPDRQPVQIKYIVKESLKLLRSSIPTTIAFKQKISDQVGIIMADPSQIHQIMMNLCTNAYHAMERTGGTLGVEIKNIDLNREDIAMHPGLTPGRYVLLSISDNGSGMDQKTYNRIFDPYFTTKELGKGTGLGLAVVHGIVKAHGGNISVHSELGVGSTFHVYLPQAKISTDKKNDKPVHSVPGGTECIMFVDDEAMLADLGEKLLEKLGYTVHSFTESPKALQAFKEKPDSFDLVITDMTMPLMAGTDLSKELLTIRQDIPIILFSGFSEMINKEKAQKIGIRKYLMKPIVQDELAAVIRRVLDNDQ